MTTEHQHVLCPVCKTPLSYSIAVLGARKKTPPCANWVCVRNFIPPNEGTVKALRNFLRWKGTGQGTP